jgi:hypothetical protein
MLDMRLGMRPGQLLHRGVRRFLAHQEMKFLGFQGGQNHLQSFGAFGMMRPRIVFQKDRVCNE